MDIETSKNDNNLDESYEEDNFEMNSEIIEEKTTPENYSTDEYNNIIMYDSDIDDCYRSFEEDLNEESRCDKNNYENFNECDEDIDSQKEDYDEGFQWITRQKNLCLVNIWICLKKCFNLKFICFHNTFYKFLAYSNAD